MIPGWEYQPRTTSPAVTSTPAVLAMRARQAQDSAAARPRPPITPRTLWTIGLKEFCRTAAPEEIMYALRAYDAASEEQAVQAGNALAGRPRADGSLLERLEQRLKTLPELESTMAKTKTTSASAILRRMVAACAPTAKQATDTRYRLQAVKEGRRKKALDALVRQQQSVDAVVEALDKRQQRNESTFMKEFELARAWHRGEDVQPDDGDSLGEIPPWDLCAEYQEELRRTGEAMREAYSRRLPAVTAAPSARSMSALADIDDDFAGAGRKLRGQDSALTPEAVFQRELAASRAALERR